MDKSPQGAVAVTELPDIPGLMASVKQVAHSNNVSPMVFTVADSEAKQPIVGLAHLSYRIAEVSYIEAADAECVLWSLLHEIGHFSGTSWEEWHKGNKWASEVAAWYWAHSCASELGFTMSPKVQRFANRCLESYKSMIKEDN